LASCSDGQPKQEVNTNVTVPLGVKRGQHQVAVRYRYR
jgi:hypothetical protein